MLLKVARGLYALIRHVALLMLTSLLPKFEENGLYALVLLAGSVIKGADVHSRVSAITQSLNRVLDAR